MGLSSRAHSDEQDCSSVSTSQEFPRSKSGRFSSSREEEIVFSKNGYSDTFSRVDTERFGLIRSLISEIADSEIEDRKSAEEMDEQRHKTLAYEYLCHLEEAKKWMEASLREKLPPTTELEENLRNGVYLAKLAHFMAPELVPLNKIYDIDQERYAKAGLQFRHTDNINHFLRYIENIKLPSIFQPETTDIYDKKNMPRVIYCIHALSSHMFNLGKASQIQDLYGKVNFTDADIDAVSKELKKYGMQLPAFEKIGRLLTNDETAETVSLQTTNIAVNKAPYQIQAIKRFGSPPTTRSCEPLASDDVQDCIELGTNQSDNEDEAILGESILKAIDALREVNNAVKANDHAGLVAALNNVQFKLKIPASLTEAPLYLRLFKKCLEENHVDGSELWLEDIENITRIVQDEVEQVRFACSVLSFINIGIEENDLDGTIERLESSGLEIENKYRQRYFEALRGLRKHKEKYYGCPVVQYVTPYGIESFLDLEQFSYTWEKPQNITESRYVTKKDIEQVIKIVTEEERSFTSSQIDEELIIKLQARIRGYLVRKSLLERRRYFEDNITGIIRLQAAWRGVLQRRKYWQMLSEQYRDKKKRLIYLQSDPIDFYQRNIQKIIKIQAFWRGYSARKAFLSLLTSDTVSFSILKRFSKILNFSADDYDKDLQLQALKTDVVQMIRHNRKLSQQLESMDIKIVLLIQNRISLQEAVAHEKSFETMGRLKNKSFSEVSVQKGIKSMTKEGKKMLDGYQHLFYALQTKPDYLAKLLFLLPTNKSNKFLQNVILTLFNFGSNMREEYLLLKLFGRALKEEIHSKYEKPSELITSIPLALKMTITYSRQLNSQRVLKQILGPVIEKVLSDKSISIETNPVDIYKSWRNQLETETGRIQNLPYAVDQEKALKYKVVRERLARGITVLQKTVVEFLTKITASRDLIPYSMHFMAKTLNDTLIEKFPDVSEKELVKVVGNFIYYHFINAAIVAPDAFDIITLPIDRPLSNDQRKNLASIAKILQFAASKKGFGEEAPHLVCLNSFIISCHEKFKRFFKSCCEIDPPEDHFSIHEYTEATLIHKPQVFISVQEICETHSLILQYRYDVAPDPLDPIHELLDDMESNPTVALLMGMPEFEDPSAATRLGKTEMCLVLTNKFEVPEADEESLQKLFLKAKELLVSILQFLKGDCLVNALETTSSQFHDRPFDGNLSIASSLNIIQRCNTSLKTCKSQLKAYLDKLELGGWVSREDFYQSIITAVAKDLCNQRKYRSLRNKELQTLKITKQRLQEKTQYYSEQIEFYHEYIQRCLENLHTTKGSMKAVQLIRQSTLGKLKSKSTLKYSAAKLAEKGVLLEIDGLQQSQFKNVIFEISPTQNNGTFKVKGKFMGVQMEKIHVDIQQLLELQFEGSTIMDMFGKAKINVNLLLHLLNRHFYGKT